MWAERPPLLVDWPTPLPLRLVLAGEAPHALSPGLTSGPALGDQEQAALAAFAGEG